MGTSMIFPVIMLLFALVFFSIGIGLTVKKKESIKIGKLLEIRVDSRVDRVMWIPYGLAFFVSSILGLLFSNTIGVAFIVTFCIFGLVTMTIYRYISTTHSIE